MFRLVRDHEGSNVLMRKSKMEKQLIAWKLLTVVDTGITSLKSDSQINYFLASVKKAFGQRLEYLDPEAFMVIRL